MLAARTSISLFIASQEIDRTLLVEHQNGLISNVWLEDDEGGTVEITGTLSLNNLEALAEDLGII